MKKFLNTKTIIVMIVGVAVWFVVTQMSANKKLPSYQTAKVEKGTIVSAISASGNVLSANSININTHASGVVKSILVKDDDTVSAGQNIAEIELDREGQQKNMQAWSSYLSAKNALESAKASQYSLQSDMFSKWKTFYNLATNSTYQNPDGSQNNTNRALPEFHIAKDDWLATETKYKNQEAVISQSQANVNNTWLSYQLSAPLITAPVSGIVKNISIIPGMMLNSQSGQRVAVIQNEANPIVSVNITEIDVSKIKIGQKVTITLDSLPDKTFTGKIAAVDRIGTTTNNVTGYPSLIQLDTASSDILPNMAANATIILEIKHDVLLVPSSAVQTQADQSYMRVLKNNREQEKPVETGISSDIQTEIISGLSEGDVVIIGTAVSQTQQNGGRSIFGGGTGRGQGGGAVFRH